jgi:hypothetical protein
MEHVSTGVSLRSNYKHYQLAKFMKTHTIVFSVASVLVASIIIIGIVKTGIVSALTATATDATTTTSVPTIDAMTIASDMATASTTSTPAATTSSTSASSATSTADASPPSSAPPAQTVEPAQSQAQSQTSSNVQSGLKLVHVVGTKYIDFFADGTTTYSFPGNPKVDDNLNKPNAPIPSHAGLRWVSTSGMEAYDTPSGDLDVGDYAQESDGSYISNVPAYTYTDATSSVPIPTHIAFSKSDPTVASSSAPAPTQASATTASTTPITSDSTIAQPAATSSGNSATTSAAQ